MKTQTTFQNFDLNKIPEDLYIPKDAFKLTLESFSGPMDLLLYLIHKKDVDILDINVAEITDQYVSYIDLMESLQIEIASDYLVMAATLAFIKSRMLLPTHEEDDVEDDPSQVCEGDRPTLPDPEELEPDTSDNEENPVAKNNSDGGSFSFL